jgi:hypothetical protein
MSNLIVIHLVYFWSIRLKIILLEFDELASLNELKKRGFA